jgi:hypothetical protein
MVQGPPCLPGEAAMAGELAQSLFLCIDPIIRMILLTIRQYHDDEKKQPGYNDSHANQERLQQLKLTRQLLNRLHSALGEWQSRAAGSDATKKHALTALAMVWDYFLLPIIATLNLLSGVPWVAALDNESDDIRPLILHRSAVHACGVQALRLLRAALVQEEAAAAAPPKIQNENQNQVEGKLTPFCVLSIQSNASIVKILTACAMALLSGQEIQRLRESGHSNGDDSTVVEILQAVASVLLLVPSHHQSTTDKFTAVQAILAALDGALLARLVDSCVALVLPPPPSLDGIPALPWSRLLLQQALDTLAVLQTSVPLASTWQRWFPGAFSGLYRRLLHALNGANKSSDDCLPTTIQCLQSLTRLIRTVTEGPSATDIAVSRHLALGAADSCAVSTVRSRLQSMTKTAKKTTNMVPDERPTLGSEPMDRKSLYNSSPPCVKTPFQQQFHSRVPGPLLVLVNLLLPVAQKRRYRERVPFQCSILRLCQAILQWLRSLPKEVYRQSRNITSRRDGLDSLSIPENQSSNVGLTDGSENGGRSVFAELFLSCFEACLSFGQASDTSVSAVASEMLTSVATFHPLVGPDLQSILIPRVVDLFEELPLRIQRTQESLLQSRLRLLNGYLSFASREKQSRNDFRSSLSTEPLATSLRSALASIPDVNFDLPLKSDCTDGLSAMILAAGTASANGARAASGPSAPCALNFRNLSSETFGIVLELINSLGQLLGPKRVSRWVDSALADFFQATLSRVEERVSLVGRTQLQWLHERIGDLVLLEPLLCGAFQQDGHTRNGKLLLKLASSIIPVLTNAPISNLPISMHDSRGPGAFVQSALRGNACVSIVSLSIVSRLVSLLEDDGRFILPAVLYPLLERLGTDCIPVRNVAYHALVQLSACGSYTNVCELLLDNIDVILESIKKRIRADRRKGAIPSNDELQALYGASDMAAAVLRLIASSDRDTRARSTTLVVDLSSRLIDRYDALLSCVRDVHFLQSYSGLLHYAAVYASNRIDHVNNTTSTTITSPTWIAMLERVVGGEPDKVDTTRLATIAHGTFNKGVTPETASTLVTLTELVAKRCNFLLCQDSLCIRNQSCESLQHVFRCLGKIAAQYVPDSDEPNGPERAILRQVAVSWPTFQARLRSNFAFREAAQSAQLALVSVSEDPEVGTTVGSDCLFCAKLLDVISEIVVCSGDFMAARYKSDVWPALRDCFRYFSSKRKTGEASVVAPEDVLCPPVSCFADSERVLVLASLRSVACTFNHRPTGQALSPMIPVIGAVILPFLDSRCSEIDRCCYETFKTLLEVDSDALHRLLTENSGPTLRNEFTISRPDASRSTKIQVTCQLLFDFSMGLPEQEIM